MDAALAERERAVFELWSNLKFSPEDFRALGRGYAIDAEELTESLREGLKYFDSPEWHERVEKLRELDRTVEDRMKELESRLEELEQRLQERD